MGQLPQGFSTGDPKLPTPRIRAMPVGKCGFCDHNRDNGMMPSHDASPNCKSGKHSHCTCDTCF
jgi:hypothetical protein